MTPRKSRAGLTVLELLVVIGIIAVLLGLLLAAIGMIRVRAYRAADENHLRQIGLAAQLANTQNGRLPPLAGPYRTRPGYATLSYPTMVWLLPYLEQGTMEELTDPLSSGNFAKKRVPLYLSRLDGSHSDGYLGDGEVGVGNYAANVAVFGAQRPTPCGPNDGRATIPSSFPDGTANTLLFATKRGICGGGGSAFAAINLTGYCQSPTVGAFFGQRLPDPDGTSPTFQDVPSDADCDPEQAQGLQRGLILVGVADGGVRPVRAGISPAVWRAAILPKDGSIPGADW